MKERYLVPIAISLCVLAILSAGTSISDAAEYESPFGMYSYNTHGSGSDGDPYWSNIEGFDSSEKTVTIQSSLEGYQMFEISAGAFGRCEGMTDLVLPVTLKRIGANAFHDCISLERIYFLGDKPTIDPSAIPSDVELYHLSGTSGWGSGIKVLDLRIYSGSGFSIGYYVMDGEATIHSLIDGTVIMIPSHVSVGGTEYTVMAIGNESFRNTNVREVHIPDSVTLIGVRAFYHADDLETISFPAGLKIVADEAFRECGKLSNMDLHSAEYIGFESFRMCYSLTEVIIPDTVTSIHEGSFRVCTSVKLLVIGSGITDIPPSCFDYYYSLETIEVRGTIKSIGASAFFNSSARQSLLERIDFPDVESIGAHAFRNNISLEKINFGNSLKSIGNEAFYGCRGIVSLTFPGSLESIGNMAFYDNRELEDAYFEGSMPQMGEFVFGGSDVTVHCKGSYKDSWIGYDGKLVVDGERNYPNVIWIILIIVVMIAAFVVMSLKRRKDEV